MVSIFTPAFALCGQQQNDFTVLHQDPHGFDRDNDGIGCEANE